MRRLAAVVCSLLLAAGAVAAQGGDPDSADCQEQPDQPRCQSAQEYCEEHPEEPRCEEAREYCDQNETVGECHQRYCEEGANASSCDPDGNATADDRRRGPRDDEHRGPPAEPAGRACRDADDREACYQDYCEDHEDARDCRAYREVNAFCDEHPGRCEGRAGDDALLPADAYVRCAKASPRGQCEPLLNLTGIHRDLRHVAFEVGANHSELLNYAIDGRLYLEGLKYSQPDAEWDVERRGKQVRFETDDARLAIHDTPTGTFWFRSDENTTLFLMVPDDANVTFTDQGASIDYDGYRAILTGKDIESYQDGIVLAGEASFHAPPASPPGAVVREAVVKAIGERQMGASIDTRGASPDVVSYDDVDVNVSSPPVINVTDVLRVEVGSNLTEGRTIAIDVDPARLAGPELVVRYFDVHDDGNETEVIIREADDLADAMDASDDGGQPEYWIVEDVDGLHLIVSVPHWSVHAIELASIGEFLVQPSVLVGAAAGVGGVAVAAIAVFWPRKPEEI